MAHRDHEPGLLPHVAEAVSWLSVRPGSYRNQSPRTTLFGKLVIGADAHIQPVRYQIARTPAQEVGSWAAYPGDIEATRLPWPARFKRVAETIINAEAFEGYYGDQEHRRDMAAIAYAFDESTVMAAIASTRAPHEFFRRNPSFYARLGHGSVELTAGLYNPWERRLTVPEGAVEAGQIMDMSETPRKAPIY